MAKMSLVIDHEAGLHARPLAQFVQTVNKFESEVNVTNVTRGKGPVNGRSPVKMLLLAVVSGHEIEVEATGADENEVLAALKELVENNFGE